MKCSDSRCAQSCTCACNCESCGLLEASTLRLTPPQAEKLLKGADRELPDDLFVKRPSSGSSMAREGSTRPDYATNVSKAQDLLAKLKERGVGDV